ncbi:E3 ubiquitin/ISG15 ligase TRIM25-like [Chiloscyllium punctatum]|uniref:RING-type E3 ubiquitin transferase n=1 Tax=Chiloscyllium punctatum TaxID=137246 RepID=A0A401RTX5_CHIPU|nr:hypothetical protein [Chiloscyllium punctatum]
MATSASVQAELCCPVCLDLLREPVTTNCGHNFCSKCLEEVWDEAARLHQEIQCPQCRYHYTEKPVLKRNVLLVAVIEQLTKKPDAFTGEGHEVACDSCFDTVHKAEKTCLTCMASFCGPHLWPHLHGAAYQDHEITSPIGDLQGWKCKEHRKIQDVFCTNHDVCICASCKPAHSSCKTIPLAEQRKMKQVDLQSILGEISEEVKVTQEKLGALANERCSIQETTSKMMMLIGERFKEIKKLLISKEESMRKLLDEEYVGIETKIEATSRQLCDHIEKLSQTKSGIEPLAKEKDQWRFMKGTSSIPKQVTHLPPPEEPIEMYNRRLQFKCKHALKLISNLRLEMDKLWQELMKYGEFCEVTFDPSTAQTQVVLSEGNRKIVLSSYEHTYDNHLRRFTSYCQVLCTQKFSQGCHYWDICTKYSSGWAIGIAYESINRGVSLSNSKDSWCLQWNSSCNFLAWHNGNSMKLACAIPQTVRVCLDFDGGSVSFYSVGESITLLHKYNVAFTEPVYPACWLLGSATNNALSLESPL